MYIHQYKQGRVHLSQSNGHIETICNRQKKKMITLHRDPQAFRGRRNVLGQGCNRYEQVFPDYQSRLSLALSTQYGRMA